MHPSFLLEGFFECTCDQSFNAIKLCLKAEAYGVGCPKG
jgi:hypothetical protein